jgi:hypothetical protein
LTVILLWLINDDDPTHGRTVSKKYRVILQTRYGF